MNQEMMKIRDLSQIRRRGNRGIFKRWVLKNKNDYRVLCDYMEKVRFCVEDLNKEIESDEQLSPKSVVYIIMLTTWIGEATFNIRQLYKKEIMQQFQYREEENLQKMYQYLRAIRSFVAAHPTTTSRYPEYGFDGNVICSDIRCQRNELIWPFINDDVFYAVDYNGITKSNNKCKDNDVVLYCYKKNDVGTHFHHYNLPKKIVEIQLILQGEMHICYFQYVEVLAYFQFH